MAFATAANVAARQGVAEYTGTDLAQVNALLDAAYDLILDSVGKTAAWAEDEDTTVPDAFQHVSVEVVSRALANPNGARSTSESLGTYSYSQSFQDGVAGFVLTAAEERRLRLALYGRLTASATLGSILKSD